MTFFGPDLRNGLPIGLGSVAGFGIAPRFSPASLFTGGVNGAWYDPSDSTTLFSDRAGTTPCGTPGGGSVVPVGLMLDKSQGLVLGPELVTNGDFSGGTTGWTAYQSTLSAVGGKLRITATAGAPGSSQPVSVVSGKTYKVTFEIDVGTVGGGTYFVGNTLFGGSFSIPSSGTYTFNLTSGTTNAAYLFYIHKFTGASAGQYFDIDNVSIKELAGNHAIAANDTTARPELSARVNLLTYSEQFDNAAWTKTNLNTTGTPAWVNVATAPDGSVTADKAIENTSNVAHYIQKLWSNQTIAYTWSIYLKAAERTFGFVSFRTANLGRPTYVVVVNLATGVATDVVNNTGVASNSYSISDAGNGWWRITLNVTNNSTYFGETYFEWGPSNSGTPAYSGGLPAYLGDGTSGIFIWGADLRPANIGSTIPAYQRIADQYTYDNVGFPRYLAFNGTNSAMSTPASIPFATVTSDGQARRNLLTNPTQFDASGWTPNSATIAANSVAAPDASVSADSFITNAATTTPNISQTANVSNGVVHTLSVYFQYNPAMATPWVEIATVSGSTLRSWFNVQTGAAGTINHTSGSVTSVGGNWYRCQVTFTSGAVTVQLFFAPRPADGSTGAITGNGTNPQFYIWGAQLETGSTATAFQNIGTDKATVFAGVRKLAQATNQRIVEFSDQSTTNNGAFQIFPGDWATGTGSNYSFSSRGTITALAQSPANYAAPVSNVLTGFGDIAGDSVVLRINGAQVATSATDQGTGNFGTYPLFIGARNTSSLWLNGYIYSLIVAGSAVSAANITATETWVNNKVGGAY